MEPIDIDELERSTQRPRATAEHVTLTLIRLSLEALGNRALVWVAALGGGAMWIFVMQEPTWVSIVAAVGYCLTILAPILMRDAKGG